jgi:hypothetical protein
MQHRWPAKPAEPAAQNPSWLLDPKGQLRHLGNGKFSRPLESRAIVWCTDGTPARGLVRAWGPAARRVARWARETADRHVSAADREG